MKKLFAMLTALVMLFSCAALAETAELVGDWYLQELQGEGMTFNAASLGMDITMTLNEDNTVVMTSTSEGIETPESATWAIDENGIVVTIDGESATVALEDGKLLLNQADTVMVFGREPAQAEPLPVPVAAESEDAFLGTWNMTAISMMGMLMPTEAMGSTGTLTVEAGKAVIASDGQEDEYTTAFADGQLTLTSGEETNIAQLNDDGSLSITVAVSEEMVIVTYFEKAE